MIDPKFTQKLAKERIYLVATKNWRISFGNLVFMNFECVQVPVFTPFWPLYDVITPVPIVLSTPKIAQIVPLVISSHLICIYANSYVWIKSYGPTKNLGPFRPIFRICAPFCHLRPKIHKNLITYTSILCLFDCINLRSEKSL